MPEDKVAAICKLTAGQVIAKADNGVIDTSAG